MSLTITTPATDEPLTLAEVKHHARITSNSEDIEVLRLLRDAREWCETFLGQKLLTQTLDWRSHGFEPCMKIPISPIQSITSVKYIDVDGVEQTLAASEYEYDRYSHQPLLRPAYDKSWPDWRPVLNAVTIRLVAGYGAPQDVPSPIKGAICLLVTHWFENREAANTDRLTDIPFGVKELLRPYYRRIF